LFDLLGVLLEASLPSRVVAIDMVRDERRKRWHARLHDPRLREEADFISVRSPLPVAQLLEQFPLQCKAGSPDEVDRVVNGSQPGIPLRAMSTSRRHPAAPGKPVFHP
jgi:type VI secretion system protein ImpJ